MDTLGFRNLVTEAQAGDPSAMDRLMGGLRGYMEQVARPYANPLKPEESTADLVQNSSVKAWEKLDTFRGGENDEQTYRQFRGWLAQIVRRLGMNARRDQKRQIRRPEGGVLSIDQTRTLPDGSQPGGLTPMDPERTPASHARSVERSRRIQAALDSLEDRTGARIVRRHLLESLPLTDVAEELGLPYEKARKIYHATMDLLQKALSDII